MSNNGLIGRGVGGGGHPSGVRTVTQGYANNINSDTNIITHDLILYLDAGNPLSYPGSGSIWYDISPGRPYNMTLFNSPTFSRNNGGIFQFNGTNQYGSTSLNMATGIGTIMCGTRYSGATQGRVVSADGNNWLLGHHNASVTEYYAEGWVQDTAVNDQNWRIYAGTHNTLLDWYSLWINGVNVVTNSTAGAAGPNGLCVGRWGQGANEWSTCEISFLLAYNRLLSTAEIVQNYNVFRKRLGI